MFCRIISDGKTLKDSTLFSRIVRSLKMRLVWFLNDRSLDDILRTRGFNNSGDIGQTGEKKFLELLAKATPPPSVCGYRSERRQLLKSID